MNLISYFYFCILHVCQATVEWVVALGTRSAWRWGSSH